MDHAVANPQFTDSSVAARGQKAMLAETSSAIVADQIRSLASQEIPDLFLNACGINACVRRQGAAHPRLARRGPCLGKSLNFRRRSLCFLGGYEAGLTPSPKPKGVEHCLSRWLGCSMWADPLPEAGKALSTWGNAPTAGHGKKPFRSLAWAVRLSPIRNGTVQAFSRPHHGSGTPHSRVPIVQSTQLPDTTTFRPGGAAMGMFPVPPPGLYFLEVICDRFFPPHRCS